MILIRALFAIALSIAIPLLTQAQDQPNELCPNLEGTYQYSRSSCQLKILRGSGSGGDIITQAFGGDIDFGSSNATKFDIIQNECHYVFRIHGTQRSQEIMIPTTNATQKKGRNFSYRIASNAEKITYFHRENAGIYGCAGPLCGGSLGSQETSTLKVLKNGNLTLSVAYYSKEVAMLIPVETSFISTCALTRVSK